jgi:hypothetical protein
MIRAFAPASRVLRTLFLVLPLVLLVLASPVSGQQTYVTRFDAFGGYAFLDSPHVSLFENGFATQVGARVNRWLSLGIDYTLASGDLALTPTLLTTTLQQQLGGQLGALVAAGKIPPSYSLTVAAHSRTQTFAAGPQLSYRHFTKATLFLRPVFMGIIHETATPKTTPDPIATAIIAELAPSGKKTDNVLFYGFGGGFDIIFSNHFSWRTQADLVYDHLFSDLLKDGRFTTRFSTGPAFNFGRNIAK